MDQDLTLTPEQGAAARQRRLEAMHLQRIEGNPLDAEDIALFEMFDRERWSFERRLAHPHDGTESRSNSQQMTDDPYVYPGSDILRNLPDIRDQSALDKYERLAVTARMEQGVPTGNFDLDHLKVIHRHLFQDVYPWAGEIRTVSLSKGNCAFMPVRFIETGMADVCSRLKSRNFLREMDRQAFVREAAVVIGDVNHIHPFREGNGRTQMQYLQQLAQQAGHRLDVRRIEPELWIDASISANRADYALTARVLRKLIVALERSREARQLRLLERERSLSAGRGR